jgi:phosphate ABC transporter phosphate-binding protein
MRRISRVSLAALLVAAATSPAAFADGPTINGSGSTWSAIAIDQWRADVGNKRGLTVNYNSVGSSSGREYYISLGDQTDFAVSEIPFVGDEVARLKAHNRTFQYLPIVAGGTSMMYNLKDSAGRRIRDLRLSPDTIAGIFTGAITKWNDPKIAADYGRPLPAIDITPVIRSDGSGTSAQFAAFLAHESSKIWSAFAKQKMLAPGMPVSNYPDLPNSIAQKGSDGIANYVANPIVGLGAIGYLESSYAVQRNFPVVAVKNHAGKYVLPTSRNVSTALTKATLNADRTQNLEGVYTNPAPGAYPISSYSYMIVPNKTGLAADKTAVLGKFMLYFACEGQQTASLLGYSPLPKNLVSVVFDAVRNLPAGRPTPPDLTFAACPNPTLRADGDLGEGADILRGSLPYGSNGDVAATGQTGNGTGTGTGTSSGNGTGAGTGGTVTTGGANPGVYSALEPTKLTVKAGSGTGLTITAVAFAVAALTPLAVIALRRRRQSE